MSAIFCYVSNELALYSPGQYTKCSLVDSESHYMYISVSHGILQSQSYYWTVQTKIPDIESTFRTPDVIDNDCLKQLTW